MLTDTSPLVLLAALLAGLALDRLFGEPRRWHPLVGFGRWATAIETRFNTAAGLGSGCPRVRGLLAWLLAVSGWVALCIALRAIGPTTGWIVDSLLLYFAIGARSLAEHAEAVAAPLANGDLPDDESLAESILYGIEREAPGQWVLDSADESDPEDYSSQAFSWSDCDCCGSDLGGSRERAAIVTYGTEV